MPTSTLQRPHPANKVSEVDGSLLLSDGSQAFVIQQAEVAVFLASHPLLAATLDASLSQMSRFFGPNLRLFTDVIENEDTGQAAELYVAIETGLDVQNAMNALDRFCREWLYPKPRAAWEGLIFDVKFP